jgi:hypothetical protein
MVTSNLSIFIFSSFFCILRLGFILGAKIYIDFTKYGFDECMTRLEKELKMFDQGDTKIIQQNDCIEQDTAEKIPSSELIVKKKSVYLWTIEDTENWFNNKKIHSSIKENMSPCDGRLLEQLYKMSHEVPEFFYSTLRLDTKANLKDIACFTVELRLLFI